MSTHDTHDKSPDGPVQRCDHCQEPRGQWSTDRYATHLANECEGLSDAGQATFDKYYGRTRRGP